MVVIVHGGPSAAVTPRYIAAGGTARHAFRLHPRPDHDAATTSSTPNPRGSYGQGEAFTRANIRDFGRGDLRDILAGVDAVEKIAPVDDARLGIYGHSYGGWMTMWANTQTQRFKAAVAGAGIANWTSYYGQNGIDQWMIPFFGASVYDDPAVYRAASPIEFIKQAKTPTLIYVGERDVECPARAVAGILARAEIARRPDAADDLCRRRPPLPQADQSGRPARAHRRLVRSLSEIAHGGNSRTLAASSVGELGRVPPLNRAEGRERGSTAACVCGNSAWPSRTWAPCPASPSPQPLPHQGGRGF